VANSSRSNKIAQSINLVEIRTEVLEIGMYVHQFGDSWLSHPFWRTAFLIKDPSEIARLVDAGIKTVVIDKDQCLDQDRVKRATQLSTVAPTLPPSGLSNEPGAAQAVTTEVPSLHMTTSRSECYEHVRVELENSLDAVTEMFESARLNETRCIDNAHALAAGIYQNVCEFPMEMVNLARLKTRDNYTYMHSVAVSALMILLAKSMALTEDEVKEAGLAGLMHDIGKSFVSDMLLKKQGPLTPAEFLNIKRHPELGALMLKKNGLLSKNIIDACHYHHEKYNGEGYPQGLKADETPLLARMTAVCDVYDAVTSERPYKHGWDPAYAIHQMATWRGHFDPVIFQSFVRSIGVYPNGSLVRLSSNRLAVVCKQNSASLLKPVVNVFYCIKKDFQTRLEPVDLSVTGSTEEITAREPRENWGFSAKLLESMGKV